MSHNNKKQTQKRQVASTPTPPEKHTKVSQQEVAVDLNEDMDFGVPGFLLRLVLLVIACVLAFYFRLHAVFVFGKIIHEFDPWFNFRATEYMLEHGVFEFFNWFDEMSWWPIGRHVGLSTYPGLQLTSVFIYHFLEAIGQPMSINDICVYVPALFGSITTIFTYLLSKEISGSANAATIAALVMSILPAHLMRSVAGGYDNEAIALSAMVSTFYLWLRSLRTDSSWVWSPLTALSYIYMVAAWGGYTFVINMVGLHAGVLLISGRFSRNLHVSYSIFYFLGTWGAIQFPVVGNLPLKSLEQVMPMMVFFALHGYRFIYEKKQTMNPVQFAQFQMQMVAIGGAIGVAVFGYLTVSGFFGPLSNRIRSLFIAHTRTGNPLVDSVSEHQATAASYYWQYFHYVYYAGPLGFFLLFSKVTDAKIFGILYSVLAYYFSQKMVRLLLILSTPASLLAGMFISFSLQWSYRQLANLGAHEEPEPATSTRSRVKAKDLLEVPPALRKLFPVFALILIAVISIGAQHYFFHCDMMAHQMSHPQILVQGRNNKGEPVIIRDFMDAYEWLRDRTPADSRVMAWWDYGYQINGVSNRTTIADGNTWNHEHIALLGRALVSPEKKAWRIARHLADYVLVWTTRNAGMYGDDLAKMPHMANIAGSVYSDVPRQGFYMDEHGNPSPLMRESLLYKLSVGDLHPGAEPLTYFKHAYTSPNRMVRIWKVLNVAPRHPFGEYSPKLELGQFHGR